MAMRLWEFMTAITAIGCSTGVIITTVDRIFGTRRQSREEELRRVKEQSGLQAQQIAELRRQNEQLQKQLEWHARLLEAQEPAVAARVTARVQATELLVREP
jgi:predicted transcriptional regulator